MGEKASLNGGWISGKEGGRRAEEERETGWSQGAWLDPSHLRDTCRHTEEDSPLHQRPRPTLLCLRFPGLGTMGAP